MKKRIFRIFSLILTLALVSALLPVTASAAGHVHDGVTFSTPISTLDELKALFAAGGSGYLTADITSDHTRETIDGKTVDLCLNGHTLLFVRTVLSNNSILSVYDCAGNGQIASDQRDLWGGNGGAFYVGTGSTFNLHSGTITKWRSVGKGSGICVGDAASTFNMYGGSIEDCYSSYKDRYGVGVALMDGGKMTMSGGTIKGNTIGGGGGHGGGVYVCGSTVEWDGASIPTTAQFVMTGGTISGNYAGWSGGGIMIENGSFLMAGGTISGNTSGDYGKGIGVYDSDYTGLDRSWAYIKGGTISSNSIQTSAGGRAAIDAQNVTLSTDEATYLTGACSYAYSIDYSANGGTDAPASGVGFIAYNDTASAKYVLPASEPVKTGYSFDGWYSAPVGGTQITEETLVSNIFEKQTIYAHWKANQYNISFDAAGGIAAPAGKENQVYDESYTLPSEIPTREDYSFLGWNTKRNGAGTNYAPGATVSNLTSVNGETVTLYAHWQQHGIRELTAIADNAETEKADNVVGFDVMSMANVGDGDGYADITYYFTIEWEVSGESIQLHENGIYVWNPETMQYEKDEAQKDFSLGGSTSLDMTITVTNRSNAEAKYAVSYADSDDDLTTVESKKEDSAAEAAGTLASADRNGAAAAAPNSGYAYAITAELIDAEENVAPSIVYTGTITVTELAEDAVFADQDELTLGTYTVTFGAA